MHRITTAVTTLRRTCLTIAHGVCVLFALAAPASAQPDDLFAPRAWHIEFQTHAAVETWNYNLSHENMTGIVAGFTYGLGKGLTLVTHAPLYHVDQRGTDAALLGVTCGVRSGLLRRANWAGFWEVEVGISKSDAFTPPGGTRFNYLAQGGVGVTRRLSRTMYLLAGLKWVHVSNNSLAGRSRNPDIEAVGPHVAVLTRF